jgi:hypothetical protein
MGIDVRISFVASAFSIGHCNSVNKNVFSGCIKNNLTEENNV